VSLAADVWAIQTCPRRKSHCRVWRVDPRGDVRSACYGCRIKRLPTVTYHYHMDEAGAIRRICFAAYGQCDEGTRNVTWLHPSKLA
jgi:hypothetical protein